jgi:hypothetical protein
MYKFEADPQYHYSEAPQSNSLRWQVYYRDGDTFLPQTGRFMCKDYLNDVVARYHGKHVIAYGLNNHDMKLNDDGVWLRLYHVTDIDVFMHNIACCINAEKPDFPLTMEVVDGNILMFVPRYYFNQTYLISLVSYIIRISNGDKKFKNFEDALTSKHAQADRAIYDRGFTLAKSWKFDVPEEFQKYWTYYSAGYNSELDNYSGTTVHNCGVMAWCENMTAEQINQKEEENAL